jgi:hypothetical protein
MQSGTRLDHYEIVDLLGEGGMGAVYRAEDSRLKRQVAIKVLPPELAADAERLARLEREAQLLASLNHPNVATVHGFGDVTTDIDGAQTRVTFLVMELVEGESLYERAKMGPMPWREVVEIGIGIAAGLEAAHERGIVHRDLKPANVHLAHDGTVKVLDFGLAKAFDNDGQSGSLELSASPTMAAATRTGVILGTAAYMSPEQARGQTIDKRADIWALGCVLYELLVGRKTFDGGTVSDILASILKEHADLEALPPIPASLRNVLERSLEKDPARRLRDVGDMRLELEAARAGTVAAAADPGAAGTSWKLVAGIAALAVFVGLGAGFVLRGGPDPSPQAHVTLADDSIAAAVVPLAISPDGRWVAETDISRGIRLRAVGRPGWRDLDDTTGAMAIAFSADSQRLYFTRGFGFAEASLHRVDVFGTSPVLEGTFGPGAATVSRSLDGRTMISTQGPDGATLQALNPDGTFTEVRRAESSAGFYLTQEISPGSWLGTVIGQSPSVVFATVDSSETTELIAQHFSPRYLGNGRVLVADTQGRLLSVRIDPATGVMSEAPVVRLEGLSLWNGLAAGFDIANDGTFAFSAGATAASDLILGWLDPAGAFTPVTERGGQYEIDSFVSPNGRLLAVEIPGEETTIAIHDLERDVLTELVPGAPIAFPVWSPDSRYVAYRFVAEAHRAIYRAPVDRSAAPELLLEAAEDRYVLPTDWSPDGAHIIYVDTPSRTRRPNGGNDLWLLPLDGSEPVEYLATPASEIDGRFSPDGKWVAYASNQSGRYEVYLRPLAGGGEFRISGDGGSSPEWNPMGGEIFFQAGDNIHVADIDVSGATPIVSPERLLVEWSSDLRTRLWAPSADGTRFLVAQINNPDAGSRSVQAIFNWSLLQDWQ